MTQTLSPPISSRVRGIPAQAATTQACFISGEILRGQKAVEINHNGSTYKLQATRLGKTDSYEIVFIVGPPGLVEAYKVVFASHQPVWQQRKTGCAKQVV